MPADKIRMESQIFLDSVDYISIDFAVRRSAKCHMADRGILCGGPVPPRLLFQSGWMRLDGQE
jgi:hypothetical protein